MDTITEQTGAEFTALISRVRDAAFRAKAGTLSPDSAADELIAAGELVKALNLWAYPVAVGDGAHADDRAEQVVITVHGVDVSIRGREDDLFVHVDSSERDTADAEKYPLVVEVNDAGENEYR